MSKKKLETENAYRQELNRRIDYFNSIGSEGPRGDYPALDMEELRFLAAAHERFTVGNMVWAPLYGLTEPSEIICLPDNENTYFKLENRSGQFYLPAMFSQRLEEVPE